MKSLIALFLFTSFVLTAQTNEDRIEEIRSLYKDVESRLKNCREIPLTLFYDEDYVTGGSTETVGYYDTTKKELIKITETSYYDWAEDVTSYYFHKGELFFIFSKGNSRGEMYTADELGISEDELWESGGEAKTLIYYENRYYFLDKTCIRHLSKEVEIDADKEGDLSKVENEKADAASKDIIKMNTHGYKLYRQFIK
ncbi:MAG: hypothetical protein HUJ25_00995 [Crocinitomicaceae bacterium]|nr:hypothetical protein [Crocinitomicaceae bacterium]